MNIADDVFFALHSIVIGILGGVTVGVVEKYFNSGWLAVFAGGVVILFGILLYYAMQKMRNEIREEPRP